MRARNSAKNVHDTSDDRAKAPERTHHKPVPDIACERHYSVQELAELWQRRLTKGLPNRGSAKYERRIHIAA